MSTVFVKEQDAHIRELIIYNLNSAGFTVSVNPLDQHDAAIIDCDQSDSFNLCAGHQNVIMLVSDEDEMIQCFDAGAGDCLVKPFSVRELVARVRALFRRPTTTPVSPLPWSGAKDYCRRVDPLPGEV